ncbi:UPF0158 family protein [Thermophagus xiamenensis]|uniref:Uncharacterized protein family (UPF0158) n=1 Tax=Thermophagus xiamenensis TaxID=385682 RepID=A0A1I2CAH0_9BACT|nr:UPF0158 family protein [Thermophagus xiamenensis]SFE64670.1 Uncharacterised protein family (UPF0158) [Thermophagus xiamenensis]
MSKERLLDQILGILRLIKDDRKKLEKLLDFMMEEIYEEPEEAVNIPPKYKKIVKEIAESIDTGFICFLNLDTLETESIPNDEDYLFEFESAAEEFGEGLKYSEWEHCIKFEPLPSYEAFKIMEDFIDVVDDDKVRNRLINALNRRKPFANFKNVIDSSQYRQAWFDYKQQQLELRVWDKFQEEIK